MSLPVLSGIELIAWVERTSSGWKQLLAAHPHLLQLPCDIRETTTVAGLVQHIVAVELRYAERLSDLPQTDYSGIPFDSAEALYNTHDRAMQLIQSLDRHNESWWLETIQFQTRSAGTLQAQRKVILFHLLMHSIRHYAQLATIARKHEIAPEWMMDYLEMGLKM
jgi:uncharacterized damage-inducible protein DinB